MVVGTSCRSTLKQDPTGTFLYSINRKKKKMDGLDEMTNAVRLEIRYTAVGKMEFKFI